MSIITYSNDCYLLCHLKWYEKFHGNSKILRSLITKLFNVKTPFLMDGKAAKVAQLMDTGNTHNAAMTEAHGDRWKKRKRLLDINKVDPELKYVLEKLAEISATGYFSCNPSSADVKSNNAELRRARERFVDICDESLNVSTGKSSDEVTIRKFGSSHFIIPPNCTWYCADVFAMEQHLSRQQFDLVVMDPPWRNKYVRRKKKLRGLNHSYETMDVSDLFRIHLMKILKPNAIVLIWISNNDSILSEVLNNLHHWDLTLETIYCWIKVTKSGIPVCPAGLANGKVPYEKILVTRRINCENTALLNIPKKQVICSIPSGIHSHKPPLKDLVNEIFKINDSHSCLEVFARCLTPGWTSYGLEVLKLQNSKLFCNIEDTVEINYKISTEDNLSNM